MKGFAIDFGSTNSGALFVDGTGKIHDIYDQADSYPKQPTGFYIREDIFNNDDISLLKVYSMKQGSLDDCNFIWNREQIVRFRKQNNDRDWVYFEKFKMRLYGYDNRNTQNVRGYINGTIVFFDLNRVIKFFLCAIKLDCLAFHKKMAHRDVDPSEYKWSVTIPSLWSERHQRRIKDIASTVFPNGIKLISEPEGALLGILLSQAAFQGRNDIELINNNVSLIVDSGGGTTDMVITKEVNSEGGRYIDSVIPPEGIDIGGNDIDRKFWDLLAEKLSQGMVGSLDLFENFKSQDPLCWHEMEQRWNNIKHADLTNQDNISFQFPSDYMRWLKRMQYTDYADLLSGNCGDLVLSVNELNNSVFEPQFEDIATAVKNYADKSPQPINKIVFAGGLSLHPMLIEIVKSKFNEERYNGLEMINPENMQYAGGGIMRGACYQLHNELLIRRIANKNYYYTATVNEQDLKAVFHNIYNDMEPSAVDLCIDEQEYVKNESGRVVVLLPMCRKGDLIKEYIKEANYMTKI